MRTKNITIKDIATKLNISVTTVSFVLNGKAEEKHISKRVTKMVLDYTQMVSYKPNQIAQSLRTGKSNTLVLMVEDISNYFFAKLAKNIEDVAFCNGYKVLFCSTQNKDEKSIELIEFFKNKNVDGFIIVPSPGIKDVIEKLITDNQPIVLLDRNFSDLKCDSVLIDNKQSSFGATSHLILNGFRNIAFITTDSQQCQMKNRLDGYEAALKEKKLKSHVLKIPFEEITNGKSKDFIKEFIKNNVDLDAYFFATNYLTKSGFEVFKEINPRLINELGIVNFDDNEIFETFYPSITGISQPLEAIANKLMELLLRQLNQKNDEEKAINENIIFNTQLLIRESSLSKSYKLSNQLIN